ncbi:DUF7835 family putative zinc beta-ribbon protein [Halopelagius longus]|uniref:DUF7835 domain-containing protein n=1 Tax=Halopelagius longus TaxID=1236180 RepID=A0A1H0YHY0_9EURY|nr:hypothetical protein [Halopelagius longus]RDI72504.1 hypothetical protein DWB78_12670 [Halopelagius longus]SDQ14807.1 hypothetical protein SAMN05216278_0649 [Halopelagius longus]
MAVGPDPSVRTEPCDHCGRETPHRVRVELRTENGDSERAVYSREPYRISVCATCGAEEVTRMNNA